MALKWSRTFQRASPRTPKVLDQGLKAPGANALWKVLDRFGGFGLESTQGLWRPILEGGPLLPF